VTCLSGCRGSIGVCGRSCLGGHDVEAACSLVTKQVVDAIAAQPWTILGDHLFERPRYNAVHCHSQRHSRGYADIAYTSASGSPDWRSHIHRS